MVARKGKVLAAPERKPLTPEARMRCPHCGKNVRATPFQTLMGAGNSVIIALLLDNVTATSDYWSRFIMLGFWLNVGLAVSGLILGLISLGSWISDPIRYHHTT